MFVFQSENYPNTPGVYIFKDQDDKIIYIGKANNISKRLASYLRSTEALPAKTRALISRIARIDHFCTTTEKEALLLESSLIKKHKPKYNIVLRDDKSYILFKLDKTREYPRLTLTRKVVRDGSVYFGPFTSALSARETLKFLNKHFPLRKCKDTVFKNRTRPCLQYYIGRCLAPCVYPVSREYYQKYVRQVEIFLQEGSHHLLEELNREMQEASQALEFERAARIRDQIRAIKKTIEQQTVVFPEGGEKDIIGINREKGNISIEVLFIRQGKLLDSKTYIWDDAFKGELSESNFPESDCKTEDFARDNADLIRNFLIQFYAQGRMIPESIVLPEALQDPSIAEMLEERRMGRIYIHTPENNQEERLLNMAKSNSLQNASLSREEKILEDLRKKLQLRNCPRRIEAIDASHLSGTGVVVGQIVFEHGTPKKESYRIYKFPELSNSFDDYGALSAWVYRRCESGPPWPDLLVIDGGKGQLNAVERSMHSCSEKFREKDLHSAKAGTQRNIGWDIIAIAKGDPNAGQPRDRIFLPGRKNPVNLRSGQKTLLFLQNLRDNVHRFVLSKQKRIRKQDSFQGALINLPGIGPETARKLWSHFGSLQEMKQADLQALKSMQGIGDKKARKIQSILQEVSSTHQ